MKQAYVSLVTVAQPDVDPIRYLQNLEALDALLVDAARMHETVVVAISPTAAFTQAWREWAASAHVQGPVSLVISRNPSTSYEDAMLEGLARCVGDFVLEWEANLADLTSAEIEALFTVSDNGYDVVQATPHHAPPSSRAFYRVVNRYRTTSSPLGPAVGTLYSRAAIDKVVDARHAVRHRKVLVAQSGLPTASTVMEVTHPLKGHPLTRLEEALDVLITGTRVGTRLTYWLAILAAFGGLATAAYAIIAAVWKGNAPEGWVTLMIVMGLSFAAVLVTLALLGEMLSRILKEVQRESPTVVSIETLAPRGGTTGQ
jgi:hypothetical protein